jgi:choline dehydrogenase-like flavoprotein
MPIAAFPVLTAANFPGFGAEHHAWMKRYAHMAGLLALLHDQSEGSVEPGPSLGRPRIRYALDARDQAQLGDGLFHCTEVLLAGGAREVLVPWAREPQVFRAGDDLAPIRERGVAQAGPNAIPLASTHPQSTCRMDGDPKRGVVGEWGECHDVAGLFVADMSVFPTSLGAPPQLTTAALADRTAHHILARRGELLA